MKSGSLRCWSLVLVIIAASLACQVVPTPPALKSTPRRPDSTAPAPLQPPAATPNPTTPAGPAAAPATSPGVLPPFPAQPGEPFANLAEPGYQASGPHPQAELPLPVPWERVLNRAVADGLTEQQRDRLRRDGFVVLHSQEPDFSDLRARVALRYGQPYYLTTDAAALALRQALDELLIAVEKEELRRRVYAITQTTLDELLAYLKLVPGGSIEGELRLAAAYLGVGLRLLEPEAPLDPLIAGPVEDQVAQILAGRGLEQSTLIPGFRDDFSAYRPSGHYAEDPEPAAYNRAMAWYSRVQWWVEAGETAEYTSRVPLILTLALRRAQIQDPGLLLEPGARLSAADEWAKVDAVLSYLLGPDPDDGPAEYAALMDRVYGPGLTILGLSDEQAFELFQVYARELPPVQQGADPMAALIETPEGRGWRFLGHGFRLDDYLLNQLAAPRSGVPVMPGTGVPTQPNTGASAEPSALVSAEPSALGSANLSAGLELFALLGSPAASAALKDGHAAIHPQATERLASLQTQVGGFGPEFWRRSAPAAWLYALASQAGEKETSAPAQLRTAGWGTKDLNSALGAWAGLRREPQVITATPGARQSTPQPGSPASPPPPAYVEPDPQAFYGLSQLAKTAAEGLSQRGMEGVFAANPTPAGLKSLLLDTLDLGDRLQRLGDIAARELEGAPPAQEDWALILAPLGPAEEQAASGLQPAIGPTGLVPPGLVPLGIASIEVAGVQQQVANGWIDRLYAVVPLEDGLYIAQGGVFSYYELPVQGGQPLDDRAWQRLLETPPEPKPLLADALYLPEGNPLDVLRMRLGDVYRVQPIAGRVNLRAAPDRFSRSVLALRSGDVFRLVGGPVQAGDATWWRAQTLAQTLASNSQPVEGWLLADPAWYARVW